MANNYIPGFTPSLHGQPVKRMALGGRMESGRWFNEGRDRDTGDMPYTAEVASAAPAVAQSIASSPVAALTAAAPTVAAYQQPTPEPAQANYGFDPYDLSGFDMYGLGEYASQFYQQPTPQPAATSFQSLPTPQPVQTAPYVNYATPTNYQSLPTPQPVQTAPYTSDAAPALRPEDPSPYPALTVASPHIGPAVAYRNSVIDPTYAPETKSYLQQVSDYASAQNNLLGADTSGRFQSVIPTTVYEEREVPRGRFDGELGMSAFNENNFVPAEESSLLPYLNKPVEQNVVYTAPLTDNSGKRIGTLNAQYNTPVVLVDDATGKVVYAGTGFAAAQEAAKQAEALSSSLGKKAAWSVYTGPAGSTDLSQFTRAAQETKNKGVLGTIADFALPVLGSILLPGVGGIAGALGSVGSAAAGSALGSALSGTLQGRDFGDILKGAALAGGLTYAGGSLLGGGGGGSSGAASTGASGAGSSAAGGATSGLSNLASDAAGNLITVVGSKAPSSVLTGALAAASAAPGLINYGNQVWGDQPSLQGGEPNQSYVDPTTGDIVVPAGTTNFPVDPNSILNSFLGSQFGNLVNPDYSGLGDLANQYEIQEPQEDIPEGSDEGWTVEAPKENVIIPPSAAIPELFPPINSVDIPTDLVDEWPEVPAEDNEIVVEGQRPGGGALPVVLPPVPITSVPIPPNAGLELPPTDPKKPGPSVTDILDLIKAIGIGAGAAAAGGKGGSGLSAYRGALNPIFSAKLPAPSLRPAAPRALDFDAYRYGYGPEQSFFSNVPQGALNTSTAYTGYGTSPRYTASEQYAADFAALLEAIKKEEEARAASAVSSGFAQGGYAVGGPGDGREDKIPAMLSDGEYVIDAETVAMLGNGSSKAGADALDKFRVNIRKHKGRKLSKGEFSVDAKKPEQYLKGHK